MQKEGRVFISMNMITLFAISLVAGLVGALSGMGGGIVLVPALTMSGIPIKVAIAASIVSVIATSSGSASAYVRDRITHVKTGMFLEMFTISGALIGAVIMVASAERLLFILFGVVLLGSWVALLVHRDLSKRKVIRQDYFSQWLELSGSYVDQAHQETIEYKGVRAYFGGPLMFGVGMIAGMLGIGAGALKVLVLDLMMGYPPKVSTTTSNMIIGVTALAGASVFMAYGLIKPGIVAPVAVGVVIGALAGTKILVRMKNQAVRYLFLVILLILGLEMVVRGIWGVV
ncbi:MAG: sulfite exporter TauE/SafE family protein [Peptococcaceae bacterium]|nr:sulfite exporter TauE/SafE family protein [Peptococcaceae bacterium]